MAAPSLEDEIRKLLAQGPDVTPDGPGYSFPMLSRDVMTGELAEHGLGREELNQTYEEILRAQQEALLRIARAIDRLG